MAEADQSITAIVTGGASGIGAATARRIVAGGGRVGILDLNAGAARDLVEELGAASCSAEVDVLDEEGLGRAADLVEEAVGQANALVCCAGIPQLPYPVEGWPAAEFRRIVDSHLTGTYASCRVIGGRIAGRGTGGAIVNLSSVVGLHPGPVLAYGAAKAGVSALTQALAVHWAAKKVRVNAVAPGWTNTPFLRPKERRGERDFAPILNATPMRRLMEPGEIAEVIHFLLSPAASAVTGAVVPCDGGVLAAAGWFPYGGFGSTVTGQAESEA
jgi:NAD(P)-dependent dehydrogenase (short-subunit alcohol dehydrogenase family)